MIGTAHNTNEIKFLLQRCIQDFVSNTIIITLSAKKTFKVRVHFNGLLSVIN